MAAAKTALVCLRMYKKGLMVKEGLSESARQMLARLRPDRRMSLAIGLGVVACFALAYNDALWKTCGRAECF